MQHTSKYQFNLVDATDDFSPEPLNQNAEKTEALMAGVEEALAAVIADLGAAGKNARIAWGSYTGTGEYGAGHPTSLTFPFRPAWLLIATQGGTYLGTSALMYPMTRAEAADTSAQLNVTWSDYGVSWYVLDGQSNPHISQNNTAGYTYHYLVLGYDE